MSAKFSIYVTGDTKMRASGRFTCSHIYFIMGVCCALKKCQNLRTIHFKKTWISPLFASLNPFDKNRALSTGDWALNATFCPWTSWLSLHLKTQSVNWFSLRTFVKFCSKLLFSSSPFDNSRFRLKATSKSRSSLILSSSQLSDNFHGKLRREKTRATNSPSSSQEAIGAISKSWYFWKLALLK